MSRLVILVPSIHDEVEQWVPLIERLKKEPSLSGTRWLEWKHGLKWSHFANPEQAAARLQAFITQDWVARGPYDEVVLVGHSFGALLIRASYLRASGADPLCPVKAPWAGAVQRMILFSGISRGVEPESALGLRFFNWGCRLLPPMRHMLGWYLFRGSSFITDLRIRWMRHYAGLESPPVIVQLRGANDRTVGREDSFDLEQFGSGYYIEIPDGNHHDLYRLDDAPDPEGRYALLRDAFVHAVPRMAGKTEVKGADKVVMVVHGIRADNKSWVEQVTELIEVQWPGVNAIPLEYKAVSALQFAFPPTRRKRLREFQDAYTDAMARNPNAEFNFLGHSNGTYLLGESLRTIHGMRFNNVVLVGSVLPQDYDWHSVFHRGQVKTLRVDGSKYDWPVAWLCSALRSMGQRTVGTGGFVGFAWNSPAKREFFWYAGGHGAPLHQENLPALAAFAVAGDVIHPAHSVPKSRWFCFVSRVAQRVSGLLLLLLLVGLAAWDIRMSHSVLQMVLRAAGFVAVVSTIILLVDAI